MSELGSEFDYSATSARCSPWSTLRKVGHLPTSEKWPQPDIGSLIQSLPKKVGYIDLTQNCRYRLSSALSPVEADHEYSAIANSIRGRVRRIDISWLCGTMFSGHRPFAGSNGR